MLGKTWLVQVEIRNEIAHILQTEKPIWQQYWSFRQNYSMNTNYGKQS